jgi:hypothetical protein
MLPVWSMPHVSPLRVLFALSCASGLLACASETGPRAADDDYTAGIQPGTFRMYDRAGAQPGGSCDRHSVLEIAGGKATVRDALDGVCDLHVPPNERSYPLKLVTTDFCGTRFYEGSRIADLQEIRFELIDHRKRTCRDLVDAKIVLREIRHLRTPQVHTLYSYDGAASACEGKACGADCTPEGSDEPFNCNVSGSCVATGQALGCLPP